MDHNSPVQRSLEDTARRGGLLMIFREFRWRGKVLLEIQVLNSYSLARRIVCKDTHALATAPPITFYVILSSCMTKPCDSPPYCLKVSFLHALSRLDDRYSPLEKGSD
jgi:hypothetical protein